MSKYTYLENVAMCKMNDKGFIYRLVAMEHDIKSFLTIDCDFSADINDGKTEYIGMTSSPLSRAKALWDYKKVNGNVPKFNKQTWAGA